MKHYVPAGFFAMTYRGLVRVARDHGYALAMHGSLCRDFDLIAVPWVISASDATKLVEAIREYVCGEIVHFDHLPKNPEEKPHGRLAWAIQLGGGLYIDISVMPLVRVEAGEDDRCR